MKKKIIGVVFAMMLVLSLGVAAYAAGGFTMTYLPGTVDAVTGMPAADSGTGGQTYTVSSAVPLREGYEFLDWTLDYDIEKTYTLTYMVTGDPTHGIPGDTSAPNPVTDIPAGSNKTLAGALTTAWTTADGEAPGPVDYVVRYLDLNNNALAMPKLVPGAAIGSNVTETAINISGYTLVGDLSQTLTIYPLMIGQWTFTGWCSDEACTNLITEITNINADAIVYGKWKFEWIDLGDNEIIFYYEQLPAPTLYSYTVKYIDMGTGNPICEDKIVTDVEPGTHVIEYPVDKDGYKAILPKHEWDVTSDGAVKVFIYYEDSSGILS